MALVMYFETLLVISIIVLLVEASNMSYMLGQAGTTLNLCLMRAQKASSLAEQFIGNLSNLDDIGVRYKYDEYKCIIETERERLKVLLFDIDRDTYGGAGGKFQGYLKLLVETALPLTNIYKESTWKALIALEMFRKNLLLVRANWIQLMDADKDRYYIG
uniref:Uncharacterized protein n=1 Tax=Clastoptera arizonana TaxID=38151 RepID=A0A1B6E8D3_9HEMI